MFEIAEKLNAGEPVEVPYTLDDMADDAAGVLDALGLETAHVCGASMGGMIAQTVAIRHHAKLRSFISIMSTTGDPSVPAARPEAMEVLLAPPPDGRDAAIEAEVATHRIIGSTGFPFDEDRIRKRSARVYDRCFYPQGRVRQMAAIVAHGDRTQALGAVSAPALIVHGADDPLIPVEGGCATAAALQNAELLLIDGMGHDLPPEVWKRIAEAIAKHTRAAEA
jgi:pimeloyl-ACP methyl ester carboxylesterase